LLYFIAKKKNKEILYFFPTFKTIEKYFL
jgi:hypothetical protein